ncbi:MAG TPA: bifunctional YncE family protein/alkaline phosphatase family protein [Longimicrobiaceae bacterium]|nr:bifunctional YncE family protein/alkaline phosphatase family protein [Longimicrobiaceae bacterium]
MSRPLRTLSALTAAAALAACSGAPRSATSAAAGRTPAPAVDTAWTAGRLPTGARLAPAGTQVPVGNFPLAMALSPDGRWAVLLTSGWHEQALQVVDRAAGRVVQTLPQPAAFLGLAWSPDGRTIYASGGNQDVVYRYDWADGRAALRDSLPLAEPDTTSAPNPSAPGVTHTSRQTGQRYPAGLALSADGATLYVAENLADDVAVVDLASGRVLQRLPTERYPYAIAVAPDGTVYASAWGGHTVSVFEPAGGGRLRDAGRVTVGRHPAAMLLSHDATRLFVLSPSTDRVAVVDTRTRRVLTHLLDPPPAGPDEGTTPDALALSPDGTRLLVAEADANAVAAFDLAAATAGVAGARGNDQLAGRIPTAWYPAAVALRGDTLLVLNAKGMGTGPNPGRTQPGERRPLPPDQYTLGQLAGTLETIPPSWPTGLGASTARVAALNHWDRSVAPHAAYPPFEHVIYVIKENRTYDQVLGDVPEGDGDTSLVFFPRPVSPNHHALAERFGLFDRFFVNAEVSADGHNWSTAAYATDYVEKTVASNYSGRGRSYDYEGTNRGRPAPGDLDVNAPANGYLWDLAQRAGLSFRNYGEFVFREDDPDGDDAPPAYRGLKPFMDANTDPRYPGFDLGITDQVRADEWLREFRSFVSEGHLPALEVVRLPNDHTAGASAGARTPRAYMADNDLALGRIVQALSNSPFWKNTVVFVLEDDAQDGPDHVDSHRSVLMVISPYNHSGVVHRFVNTTDVIATIAEILGMQHLSQFDYYGRPLRGIWSATPDLRPYSLLHSSVPLDERNPARTALARLSERLDLRYEDSSNDDLFNHILWRAIKGDRPYPGTRRASALDVMR